MEIRPQDFNLHGLLSNLQEQFVVPSYQRRYAWGKKQQMELFRDIDMLFPDEGHLLGMLIIHNGNHVGGTNKVQIVDGQQRITSIIILLQVIKEKYIYINELFNVNIINTLVNCGITQSQQERKLLLGALDDTDYNNLLLNNISEVKNSNLLTAYNCYKNQIDEKYSIGGKQWLDSFFTKFVHTIKIIRLDVSQSKDAYKLFEIINNRGLRLSSTDILKNFILGHAAKISDNVLNDAEKIWSEIITTLDGIDTDDFFRQYTISIFTRKISNSKLVEEFKNYYFKHIDDVDKLGEYLYSYDSEIEDDNSESELDDDYSENRYEALEYDEFEDDIEIVEDSDNNIIENPRIKLTEFLKRMLSTARCYSKINNHSFNETRINKLVIDLQDVKSFTANIFLMHYLNENRDINEVETVLKMIITLMLRRHITGKPTSKNDDIFANLLRINFDEVNYLDLVREKLLEDYPDNDEFKSNFPKHELKGQLLDRARYILREIEYFNGGNTGELSVNSPQEVHIEHIIPKNITSNKSKDHFGNWSDYLGPNAESIHKIKVHRIGNLTLLAGKLNIAASNNPFKNKCTCYDSSTIRITNSLVNYNDFRFTELDSRGEELAEIALQIWKMP